MQIAENPSTVVIKSPAADISSPFNCVCSRWMTGTHMEILCVCFPDRVLLSIMYLMVETIRVQTEDDRPEWRSAREAFKNELGVCVYVCVCGTHNLTILYDVNQPNDAVFDL